MKNSLVALILLCGYSSYAQTNYDKAWSSLNENKRSAVEQLLKQANTESSNYFDAYITGLYLKSYNGKENQVTDFCQSFYDKSDNPYPYIYALWFNEALLGQYGKKVYPHQVKLINQLIADEKAPGTLVAAANYQKGINALFSADFNKMQNYFDAIGNIRNWQYVGPFENLSESGFYKNYGPLEHPEPNAVFKSLTNADVKWITPATENADGWIPVCYQFNKQTAVVYAQNFLSSDIDQTVFCNVGFTGSIKVWLNDELIISEVKERVTEMDAYTAKINVKKGVNRILVQLGFTNSSFPNFTIRFTDEKFKPVRNISGSATYADYPRNPGANANPSLMPQFAESFFKDKIAKQRDNPVNYLLLTDVYLRNKKLTEARNLISEALQKAPDNSLLRMKLIEVLIKENNRTLLMEEIEKIKQADPESLLVMELNIKDFFDNEKYDDGAVELQKRIKLYGEDENTYGYKISLLIHEKKYDDLVKEAEKMYSKYPENSKLVALMYSIKKDVYKDNKGALKIFENYMKNNFNYGVYENYASVLSEMGNNARALEVKQNLADITPYSPEGFYELSKYQYRTKQYDKAEKYIKKALDLSPFNEKYWAELGDIKSEEKKTAEALNAYNLSLKYDPNQYEIINKIRKLNGKSELYKNFEVTDISKIIKEDKPADAKNTDYGYYYILDQKDVILYPGGANEEFYTMVIKITNDKGIERYKESSIGYNSSQTLLIEKAEVIKKNQSKIEGERNDNQIVFTNLEAGDVIVFKYRLQSYVYGRFAKEYWDKYFFGGQIYTSVTRYNLLAPADLKINYEFANSDIKPVTKNVEEFKQYSWEMINPVPVKNEPLMPVLADIGTTLHISTISDWKDISTWYSDVTNNKSEEDFEILALYRQLFPEGQKSLNQYQKAKSIYQFIESNIRYSSVPFRQSAYVPQRASATLSTRLGDCKDLSNLFVTLARMAGIDAHMVLVDTRNNGEKDILLPSVEFNHCIAKATLDNKDYYIELTDNNLPFASLPNNLIGSLILEIPTKKGAAKSQLQLLNAANRTKDVVKRTIEIKPVDSDISVTIKTVKYGNLSSGIRYNYTHLDNEKQMKNMEQTVANGYKNNVKLEQLSFNGLDKLDDSVVYSYSYKVKNEVSEIGSLKTFKVVYPDVVASLDNFSSETRTYPIEYWSYEDADSYETVVNITAPSGTKFIEVPASETLTFKDMKFSLQYVLKTPDRLVITRKFTNGRKNIPAADYAAFKSFFEKIVKAEQKFIAYK